MHYKGDVLLRKKGFTIIELLVVIVMIGLLTTAAATSYINSLKHSRDSARKSDIQSLSTAIEAYYSQNGKFPGRIALDGNPGIAAAPVPQALCEAYTSWTDSGTGISHDYFAYAYNPNLTAGTNKPPCDDPSRTSTDSTYNYAYDSTQWSPEPAWIPGLASYINPFPTEKHFIGPGGGSAEVIDPSVDDILCDLNVCTTQSANATRTYFYRKLTNGYAVYCRLETNGDLDAASNASLAAQTGLPTLPPGLNDINSAATSSMSIYLIRK